VTPSTTIKAIVDYDIHGFKPSTYYLDFVFETTTPNRTIGVGQTVLKGQPPAQPNFVATATGTITLTQDLGRVLALPELKHPIRLRVFLHEQVNEIASHVVGLSDWIEFH